MTWIAGYRDCHGHGRDSGPMDRVGALAWLLDEVDQRAMAAAIDGGFEPDEDPYSIEVVELGEAWQHFTQLSGSRGGECQAGAWVYWLAPSFDEQPPTQPDDLDSLRSWAVRR